MGSNPTFNIGSNTYEVHNDKDVKDAFIDISGFEISKQIEEIVVDEIDAELDYNTRKEQYILRCYVYFNVLDSVDMGFVKTKNLEVDGWVMENTMIGDKRLCIVYEKQL